MARHTNEQIETEGREYAEMLVSSIQKIFPEVSKDDFWDVVAFSLEKQRRDIIRAANSRQAVMALT